MSEAPLYTPSRIRILNPKPQFEGLTRNPKRETQVEEREFFIDKLLVRIRLIIVMIRWTGLAP